MGTDLHKYKISMLINFTEIILIKAVIKHYQCNCCIYLETSDITENPSWIHSMLR